MSEPARRRAMFLYWGRRGSLGRFALQLMDAAVVMPELDPILSVSRQNEGFEAFERFGTRLMPVDTFAGGIGALTQAWRIPAIRRAIAARLREAPVDAAITLMPHVWSAAVAPVFRRAGIPYATVLHDFSPHPGDFRTAAAHRLLMLDIKGADRIVTLSRAVADRLTRSRLVPAERIETLFHPDLSYGPLPARRAPREGAPWRLLFLGRIMRYKGLPLLVDAVERLRAEGLAVELGVFGEGSLGPEERRLRDLGATVVNRWQSDEEISALFSTYHALVLSHIEASQSGVAAAAFGAGMPVVATPVGGLAEQIEDGVTGGLARGASAGELADAIRRLAADPDAYEAMARTIAARAEGRSMRSFARSLVEAAARRG